MPYNLMGIQHKVIRQPKKSLLLKIINKLKTSTNFNSHRQLYNLQIQHVCWVKQKKLLNLI